MSSSLQPDRFGTETVAVAAQQGGVKKVVLDFVLFLRARWIQEGAQGAVALEPPRLILRLVPASHLDRLVGLVAWGGDAVADAERLYDDDLSARRD